MARLIILRSAVALAAQAVASGCAGPPRAEGAPTGEQAELLRRIDGSLAAAALYLVSKQSPDGAWRSETYGMFRQGPTLTPYVMSALFFLEQGGAPARASFRRGVRYLSGMIGEDGTSRAGPGAVPFPVFTCASASRVVVLETRDAAHRRVQEAYLAVLRGRQLTEALGWSPEDPEYGGWGFSLRFPRKPRPGQLRERFFESNMVATIFAIGAMRSARFPDSDPAWHKALVFVRRCQNFQADAAMGDARFDDGGFFFIPEDPLQNKAGVAGEDRFGRQRFHSYGTMTADGLRALVQCGLPRDHPRVSAALAWLERNFSAVQNPGTFNDDREVLRNATYYYWAWAVAHAFARVGVRELERDGGTVRWAGDLAEELISRQRADGSWANRYTDAREDDPLVATPWAAAALAVCRGVIAAPEHPGPGDSHGPPTPPPHGARGD